MPSLRKFFSRIAILLACGILLSQMRLLPWGQTSNSSSSSRSWSPDWSETLVVACKDTDDMSWLDGKPEFSMQNITVSRSTKGNEALAYLSYIVQNYERLSDVTIFIHNHDRAWHHDARLFSARMSRMLPLLDRAFVQSQGYFNLRCDWEPGCPARFDFNLSRPTSGDSSSSGEDRETEAMRESWTQLHPVDPLPADLGQPCCSQFAASRSRIRFIPLERWMYFRDWVLHTPLNDWFAGRVWEYTWQYLLAGDRVANWCPAELDCLCFGYGICFGGKAGWEAWRRLEKESDALTHDYMALVSKGEEDLDLRQRLARVEKETEEMLSAAIARGKRESRLRRAEDFSF